MPERSEDQELTALESALRELRPKSETMDRTVLMYRAGRASVRCWGWPLATTCSTLTALALSIALWIRSDPPVVYVSVSSTGNDEVSVSPPSPPLTDDLDRGAWSRYVHLQEQVLLHGLEGLPSLPSSAEDQSPDIESLLGAL